MTATRDDQVLFEVSAEVEAAKAELTQFVADAKAMLEELGAGAAINISIDAVQAALELVTAEIERLRLLAAEPETMVLDTSAAVAEAEAVLVAVEKVKRDVTSLGGTAPAEVDLLAAAFTAAAGKVEDFAARTVADSEKLGVGVQRAALQAKTALRSLEDQIREMRSQGGAVTPEDLDRLEQLQLAYAAAAEAAQQVAAAQAEVRAETAALQADSEKLSAAFAALVASELEVVAGLEVAKAAVVGLAADSNEVSKIDVAFKKASEAVAEFVGRTTVGSSEFGGSIERGALQAKVALQELTNQILEARAAGSPVTAQQLSDLLLLEERYRLAVVQARELARLQGVIRGEIKATTPVINENRTAVNEHAVATGDLAASVERLAAVVKAYLAVMIVSEIRELGKASLEAAKDMVSIHVALETAVGDSRTAVEEFEFVREVMNHFGLDLKVGLEGFTKLAGAARDTALAGKPVRDAFYSIAEAASAMHLSTQTQEQVFYALSEIMSKGTLQAQQLQRQLAIAIPGATQIAARALGLSIEDLEKALKAGAITAEEFIPRFAYQLDHELKEKAESAADSSVAAIGRFNNALYEAKATLGEQLLPELAKVGASLADVLRNGAPIIEFVGKAVAAWLGFASTMLHVWDGIKETVAGIAATLQEFGAQIVATVAKAIGALAGLADAVGLHEFAAKVRATAAEVGRYFGDMAEGFSDVAHEHAKRAYDDFAKVGEGASAARPAVAGLGGEVGSLGEKFDVATKRLTAMIKATVEYGNELRSQGSVTREEADKLIKEVEKELKAIRALPETERKAFADREALLQGFYNQYFKFTTEYEKLHEKQQKAAQRTAEEEARQFAARERQLLNFLQKLDEIAKRDAGGGKEREGIEKNLSAAKQELAGIQSKSLLSQDDENRAEQLHKDIGQLQRDLTQLGPAATAAGGGFQRMALVSADAVASIRDKIVDTISNSKDFGKVFDALTPQVQSDLKVLVNNFDELSRSGKVTVGDVQDFAEAFARMAGSSGKASESMLEKFRSMTDSNKQMKAAFDALTDSSHRATEALTAEGAAAAKAAGQTYDAVKTLRGAAALPDGKGGAAGAPNGSPKAPESKPLSDPGQVMKKHDPSEDPVGPSKSDSAAQKMKDLKAAEDGIVASTQRVAAATSQAVAADEKAAAATRELGEQTRKSANSADEAADKMKRLQEQQKLAGEQTFQTKTDLALYGQTQQEVVEGMKGFVAQGGQVVDGLGQQAIKLDAARKAHTEAGDAVKGYSEEQQAAGEAAKAAGANYIQMGDRIIALGTASAQTIQRTKDLAQGTKDAGEAAGQGVEPQKNLTTAVGEHVTVVEKAIDSQGNLRKEIVNTSDATAAATANTKDLGAKTLDLSKATHDLESNVKKAGDEVKTTGEAAKTAGGHLIDFGDGSKKAGVAAHDAAPGIAEVGKATAGAVKPTGDLVAQLAKIPDLKLPQVFADMAKGLGDFVADEAKALQETTDLVKLWEADLPKLKAWTEALKELHTVQSQVVADLKAAVPVLQDNIRLTNELARCQAEAAKA